MMKYIFWLGYVFLVFTVQSQANGLSDCMHFDFISHYRTNVVYKTNDEIVVVNEYKNENRGKLVINKMNDPITIFYDHKHPYVFIYSGRSNKCTRTDYPTGEYFQELGTVSNILRSAETTYIGPMAHLIQLYADGQPFKLSDETFNVRGITTRRCRKNMADDLHQDIFLANWLNMGLDHNDMNSQAPVRLQFNQKTKEKSILTIDYLRFEITSVNSKLAVDQEGIKMFQNYEESLEWTLPSKCELPSMSSSPSDAIQTTMQHVLMPQAFSTRLTVRYVSSKQTSLGFRHYDVAVSPAQGLLKLKNPNDKLSILYNYHHMYAYFAKLDSEGNEWEFKKSFGDPVEISGFAKNLFERLSHLSETKDYSYAGRSTCRQAFCDVLSYANRPDSMMGLFRQVYFMPNLRKGPTPQTNEFQSPWDDVTHIPIKMWEKSLNFEEWFNFFDFQPMFEGDSQYLKTFDFFKYSTLKQGYVRYEIAACKGSSINPEVMQTKYSELLQLQLTKFVSNKINLPVYAFSPINFEYQLNRMYADVRFVIPAEPLDFFKPLNVTLMDSDSHAYPLYRLGTLGEKLSSFTLRSCATEVYNKKLHGFFFCELSCVGLREATVKSFNQGTKIRLMNRNQNNLFGCKTMYLLSLPTEELKTKPITAYETSAITGLMTWRLDLDSTTRIRLVKGFTPKSQSEVIVNENRPITRLLAEDSRIEKVIPMKELISSEMQTFGKDCFQVRNLNQCQDICMQTLNRSCNIFSACYDHRSPLGQRLCCYLGSAGSDKQMKSDKTDNLMIAEGCKTYSINNLNRFLPYSKKTYGNSIERANQFRINQFDNLNDEQCASECWNDNRCSSFEIKIDSTTCELFSKHATQVGVRFDTDSITYTVNHLLEYTLAFLRVEEKVNKVEMLSSQSEFQSVETCAYICNQNKDCIHFNYCSVSKMSKSLCTLKLEPHRVAVQQQKENDNLLPPTFQLSQPMIVDYDGFECVAYTRSFFHFASISNHEFSEQNSQNNISSGNPSSTKWSDYQFSLLQLHLLCGCVFILSMLSSTFIVYKYRLGQHQSQLGLSFKPVYFSNLLKSDQQVK